MARNFEAAAINTYKKWFSSVFLFSLVITISCNGKTDKKAASQQQAERNSSTFFSSKPVTYFYSYDTAKTAIENFNAGYADSFSVNGLAFQLFSDPDTAGDLSLQVYKNGQWNKDLKIPYGQNRYDVVSDINLDGYKDFQIFLMRGVMLYLFDTMRQEFHSKPVYLAFEWTLLDSANQLYCNDYSGVQLRHTNLFRLENLQQIYLYTAELNVLALNQQEKLKVRIYKVQHNDLSDTIFIREKLYERGEQDFDAVEMWKEVLKAKN